MNELNQENLLSIVEKSGIGIIVINSKFEILLVNDWFSRYSYLEKETLLGKKFDIAFPELKETRTYKSIELCLEHNQYSILTHSLNPFPFPLYENHLAKTSGDKICQFLHIIPIPMERPEDSLCMIQISDVSQQVVREKLLREQMNLATLAKEEAILASNAKSDFLAAMSHEIRTPLNSILGMTEVLGETNLDQSQITYLEVLKNSGKALFNIINDILDFSRIEAGKLEVENHPYNLHALVQETVSLFLLRAQKKGIQLEWSIASDISKSVFGDLTRIQQILINLIGNAFKFTEKGKISVRITKTPIEKSKKENILFEIEDTGIGIPKQKLESIFESFTQVDNSTTRKYGGTGLGLSITRKLIHLMGGEIYLKSEEGKGSLFYFEIPYIPHEEDPYFFKNDWLGMDLPEPSVFPNIKLLLAEDSSENIFLIQTFFRKYPIHITVAENGKEAYDLFLKNKFDIVLMDMQMPVMDGNQATEKIRKWEEVENKTKLKHFTPIIALTANALKEDIKKSFDSGCTSYLTKPVKKDDILKLVYYYTAKEEDLYGQK
ncbi:ATP-binding protein [Leptospira idonii]|uniref:Sensory/regulatory protein RpfC n=1 Tax=Leptospira idonii TaxID=1193500 RepID=A0A4V3JXN6_9LEPT|nr:ATP-binding protein [Leptospira idonii]TGN17108.1 response regulator [Leptospira idonii]